MNKIDENTLMAYLYGELGPQEHKEVEAQIELHPELAASLNELKTVRDLMGKLDDKDPEIPLVINEYPSTPIFKRLMPWLGAAAVLLLLLLVGFIFETSISFKGKQLTIEFGESSEINPVKDNQALVPVIQDALQQQEELLMDRMQEMQANLEQKMTAVATNNHGQTSTTVDETMIQSQLQKYRKQQLAEMTGLMEKNIASQREELKVFLTEYHGFLEQRRIQDLQLIEAGFQTMKENVDRQKTETDEILANIITTNKTNY